MPGRKKAKGRGRQNQSRNKSHNQVVRQPIKGQSNDQHSDTDSQANAVEKEDVSSESASNGQYEDISVQASGPPEVLNQHQLEVKDDDEQEEESQIDDTSNDCSIDQEDSSAGVSCQVTAHDVFEEHQPDENCCDDQPDETYSDDQQEDQDSKSNSLDEQAKFNDTSNENSPLKSMIEQQYIQNIIGEQQLEGSLPLLVRESLFAQIAANSPYKRELEEYSPHRQDKRPIKQQRIEPDCKNHSESQQERLHCKLKQEEQDDECQDDQLPLDEQDCNSKLHTQQECQQSCSKDVQLYSDEVKLMQEGMDKQLTIKMHDAHHIGEDKVHSDEEDQKFSNQQDQHYDTKQDHEVKVQSDTEIETKRNEQVIINREEHQQVRKTEEHDSIQNIQLSAKQKGIDHAEEDEKLIAQEIEQPEAKQNEHLNSKKDEQLDTRPNEELAAELDEKLNEEPDGKQNEQLATKLNEELVVEQDEWLDDKLIGEADAQHIEKSVSELYEELNVKVMEDHNTKHYEFPTGKVNDEYDIKVNEGLDSEQKDQLDVKEIDKFDIKVDKEIDDKHVEKLCAEQQEELNLVVNNTGQNDEFDVRHSKGLLHEISEQYCIMKAKELDTEEVKKLGVEHVLKLETKQNEQLDDQENNHPVKEIEQLIAKQIEPLDAKANEEICTKQKEQHITKQNEQIDIKQITHLDGKQSEQCIIEHIEYFNVNLGEVVAAQKEELYNMQIEELDDQQNEQICEKQNTKLDADSDLESDLKENEDFDAKIIEKLSVLLDDALECEQLSPEQNEELDVREDKQLILKEHEPNVQQSEELIVSPYEQSTLKPNVLFSVKQNDELEVKENECFEGKKNEVLDVKVSDDVAYQNQNGEEQNDVDVFLNDKLSSKGIEDKDVKRNHGDQIEHYTVKKNEEIHVSQGAQPNEDLDTKQVEKLGNTQVQDTDPKQCQGINALYKQEEEFKEIVHQEVDGKQEQEVNCDQDQELDSKLDQELDGKQDQEVYGEHDQELDGKQDQELNGKQDQEDNGIQYQELVGTQDEELGGKQDQEAHDKQDEELDGKQGQEVHGKQDQELDGKKDQELDSKQDQDVNSKQDQELDGEQDQELNGNRNLDLNGMQDQELDGKQDRELDSKEDQEVNGKQDQEPNGNQDLDDEQDQGLDLLHYPEVTVQQNHKVETDQSELCSSKQVDMMASDEGKDCNGKQNKTYDNKQNEEYRNGKADCQLYDRKQIKRSGIGENVNQQDRDKQECEPKGKIPQQDPVANRLLLSVTKNSDSKINSNLNKRHRQDCLRIDEPADTHENQKFIYHQSEIESAENYDDVQHNCSFQQTDHLAFNQNKQYNGKLTKASNFKQNEKRHDCKVNQFHAGRQDEPTGINEYVNQEQEGKQECKFKEEKPQQDHLQRAFWKSKSYEKSSHTDRQPEWNDYQHCKNVQQGEVGLADNCYDVQYNLSCSHKQNDQQSEVKEIHQHLSSTQEQELQNNHSLDKHEFLAFGQAEKVNNEYEIKTGKHEEKQERKQDDKEGEKKSFSKQGNQQNVSKQDQNFRGNQYRGKQQYSSRKGFQGGYNKSWNNQKGYQHEYQQKWDQKYHRGYRNCQSNQRHHHQQQAKPQGTSLSGGLVCGVCEEKYDHRNRMPRNLYCGHTVCTSCAWRLLKHYIIVCPQCRTKTLRVSSADKLTINMPLIAILSEEATTKHIVPVSNNEGPESQPYSTEVGAIGGQQFNSSLKHSEKAIVTVSNSELMGSQSYCNVNYSTEESHSLSSSVRSPHSSRCLEVGVRPTAHCAVCDQWVCDICGRIDHLERKDCILFPLKETLVKMKQDKENMSKAVSESLTVSLKEIRCYSDQLDVLLLSMRAALECLGKEQEYIRKALQEGTQMKKNLEEVVSKLPLIKNLPEALACFQTVENDYAAAFQWISCKSFRVINNDKVKKTGKELLSITLRSLLTSTAENGVVNQIVACQETPTDKKFSQLTVNGARMHLHSLSGITTLKEARALPLECFMVCLDSTSTLTFLDLFWDGTSQGRVYIRLTGNTARGRQFLSLCTGEKGPTFRNTHFHRVWWKGHAGEHVWGGDYDQGDGSGGATLPSICNGKDAEAELGCAVPITPGLVAGRYEKKDVSSIFRIYTREAKHCMEEAAFGFVEHGLSVVEKAINHNIIQDVIISDCGVVMEI